MLLLYDTSYLFSMLCFIVIIIIIIIIIILHFRRNKALIEELSTPLPDSSDLHFKTKYSQPLFIQCLACLWKQRLSYWRNPPYTAVRFFFTMAIALLSGTIFWNLGSKTYVILIVVFPLKKKYIIFFFNWYHVVYYNK
jgi:ABC-2 type transporter